MNAKEAPTNNKYLANYVYFINYLDLSALFPLDDVGDVLVVKSSRNQQVDKKQKSSPTVSKHDQNSCDQLEKSKNFAPKSPVNLFINKNVTSSAGGKTPGLAC